MNQHSSTYSLVSLFKTCDVEIPIIQRDYAQGRENAKDIRNALLMKFLEVYNMRLMNPDSPAINLDFVYGDIRSNTFYPIDGQQRLTTLFLLHWYAAWQSGKQEKFKDTFLRLNTTTEKYDLLFRYTIRASASEFFDSLTKHILNTPFPTLNSLKQHLRNQPWYFLSWNNDPTVQSSITVLEDIHLKFINCTKLYDFLSDLTNPLITFKLLRLSDFGLNDDLYIKMNARGKPLTAFEHTKAKIEQFIKSLNYQIGDKPADNYFASKIEHEWSDLVWYKSEKQTNIHDTLFMRIIGVVMIVSQSTNIASQLYESNTSHLRGPAATLSYHTLANTNLLSEYSVNLLFTLLDTWSNTPITYHDVDTQEQIKVILSSLELITYEQLVVFAAYLQYIHRYPNSIKNGMLRQWMRIIKNLARNSIYNRVEDVQRGIRFIEHNKAFASEPVKFFSEIIPKRNQKNSFVNVTWHHDNKQLDGSFLEQQMLEEIMKARLIREDKRWIPAIEDAESHRYFKGQIDFILLFSGLPTQNTLIQDSILEQDATISTFTPRLDNNMDIYLDTFLDYYKRLCFVFTDTGIPTLHQHVWERALLTQGNYLLWTGQQANTQRVVMNFLSNNDRSFDWKRLLRASTDSDESRRIFVKNILDHLDAGTDTTPAIPLQQQLENIINTYTDNNSTELWRSMVINKPALIEYCKKRCIRTKANEPVYLLKHTQMNGEHAELYTYYIYENLKQVLFDTDEWQASNKKTHVYQSVNNTDQQPGFRIFFTSPAKKDEPIYELTVLQSTDSNQGIDNKRGWLKITLIINQRADELSAILNQDPQYSFEKPNYYTKEVNIAIPINSIVDLIKKEIMHIDMQLARYGK